ncbi:MAG: type II toxin-antitoxin system VapC family toxin [Bradyrhizobium sp.]|nr:type II toxin-antitoxin system VapC family toxin [Bradyrhizobium sp.]
MSRAMPLLLDTHAAVWVTEGLPIAPGASEAMDTVYRAGSTIFVSAITAWEIGLLVARNRIGLSSRPERWFQKVLAIPGVKLAELTPDILIQSSFLPGDPPRDPADRIIIATARDIGATLITRDRLLLKYGENGQIHALAC